MAEPCIHELDPAQCADCNGAVRRAAAVEARDGRRKPPAPGPWTFARWDGRCSDCGGLIVAGEKIRADGDGGWLCEECGDSGP